MILAGRGRLESMSSVTCQISISLDGFVAGPNQSLENPIGEGGMRLHQWLFETPSWREQHGQEGGPDTEDSKVVRGLFTNVGAYIMGRKMFGGGDGPWNESWTGWWGDDPPYHVPVFVLTHHARNPLAMHGGTTFNFVTDGIESALRQGRPAPRDRGNANPGGAPAIQQPLHPGSPRRSLPHQMPGRLRGGEPPLGGTRGTT